MSDIPPHDIDAEYATVGAMLLDNAIVPDVLEAVSMADFYNPQTARMFAEIVSLHQSGKPVDTVTLGTRLGTDYVLPIGKAAETTANTKNATYYAGTVREMAERRREIEACKKRIAAALDVSKALSRMRIRSPKTEHHEGKDSRVIPIFPELRPHLDAVWEQTEPGTVHVINRYRDAEKNLRTQLTRIIKRAGLEPWPKLFQNLRATRETELAQTFPFTSSANGLETRQPLPRSTISESPMRILR